MKVRSNISPDALRSLLLYDPETGGLTWLPTSLRPKEWNTKYAGMPAFTANHASGYKWGSVGGKQFLAHRIIWAIAHGAWADQIDHINGNRADNRLSNLRAVDQAANCKNAARPRNNKSGICGVYWSTHWKRWKALICVDYKQFHIATSKCIAVAAIARHLAEIKYGFHENHGRKQT